MKTIKIICLVIVSLFLLACLENSAPVADAGPDIQVSMNESESVELDGRASYDPNGDALEYHWSIESMPSGSQAELSSFSDPVVEFSLDLEGTYIVSLVVDDGKAQSARDRIIITYGDGAPSSASEAENTDDEQTHFGVQIMGKSCRECHQLENAEGNLIAHIPVTGDCMACHTEFTWLPVFQVDHSFVMGSCSDCHDGVLATGKPAHHIASSNECDVCHITVAWLPSIRVNHQAVIGECVDCHNGVVATGKPASHIESGDQCEQCHNTETWRQSQTTAETSPEADVPAGQGGFLFDHTGVRESCVTCHNNQLAIGKSSSHIATTDECGSCHSTEVVIPVIRVDHSQVLGACFMCHNNTIARGKQEQHVVSGEFCDACHSTESWRPVITVNHTQLPSECEACHASPANHVSSGIVTGCQDCHNTARWGNPTSPLPPLVGGDGVFIR